MVSEHPASSTSLSGPRADVPAGRSPARERLLQTATRLFYGQGIQSVGVDRLVAESEVTKATFYRHFSSKDDLVRAYIERLDQEIRAAADVLARQVGDPADVLTALVAQIGHQVCTPGFRGCAFISAAVEFPDPEHPVRRAVAGHRRWFRDLLTRLLRDTGHPQPEAAAQTLVMVRDGAMMGGYLDDPAQLPAGLRAAIDTLLPTGSP
ncbi:TetR/AcrR family transcriptional regulator [Nonomuraea rosea]|uniref:TetR/AcrR family transcriptional regulator n=1 Tax=Nonomuraea rosea TaxID=638574 RepID=A0ABP6XVC6_9ACTN